MQTKSCELSKIDVLYKIYALRLEDICQELQARNLCSEHIFKLGMFKAWTEAATRGALWKNVSLNFRNNPQENTFDRVSYLRSCLLSRTSLNRCFCMNYTHFNLIPFLGWPMFYTEVGRGGLISRNRGIGFGHEIYRWSIIWQKIYDIIFFAMSQMCSLLTQTHKYEKWRHKLN